MKYFDIIDHPNTAWGLWDEWKNRFTASQIAASPFSTKIPVHEERSCWSCRKTFVGSVWAWYCSDFCEGTAQAEEDMARDD